MESYELAYRMQTEVPGVIDIDGESQSTRDAYGIGDASSDSFGRKCLLARRLVEKGVRFVQAYAGNWDSHDYIEKAHGALIRSVDKPIAALLRDLKQRDMLKDTLVVWCGEFGRTPDNGLRGGGQSYGRDHNAKAMAMWFAGGGTRGGHTVGATDDIGAQAVECVHHIRDVHVTLLHLLGLDDNKLTYYHAGRHKQLSQFGGEVIKELLA
jgi:arylsulfatase A-like enzyme